MNKWVGFMFVLTILIFAGIFRDKIRQTTVASKHDQDNELIRKYLLNDTPLFGRDKPKLWIHSKYEMNSRKWKGFHSRNSMDLNQPYLYLTIQSIVNHCGNDFHICLIDDHCFSDLIPDWPYEHLPTLADPVKSELRYLGFLKLIYHYGGAVVPDSFLCFKSLLPWYKSTQHKPCIGQKINRTLTQTGETTIPSPYFLASYKNSTTMLEWIDRFESLFKRIPHQMVSAMSKLEIQPQLIQDFVESGDLKVLKGYYLGIQTVSGKPILIEDLLAENYLDLSPDAYGIYVPADEILARTHWQWFAYLSEGEILQSNSILAKHIMASAVDVV